MLSEAKRREHTYYSGAAITVESCPTLELGSTQVVCKSSAYSEPLDHLSSSISSFLCGFQES